VFTGNKYKLWIPSHSCVIIFSLQGIVVERPEKVKLPRADKNKPDISLFDKQYPTNILGNQILHFARDHIFQRKVEIHIADLDIFGNFMGTLQVNGKDFSSELLQLGYARLFTRLARKITII